MYNYSYCPVCHSNLITIENKIGKCNECSHGFRIAVPEEILPRYFGKRYWDNDKNRQGITSVRPSEQWRKWIIARMKLLESFNLINHSVPSKIRIFEFGCAEGMLLYALKQKGYNCYGNDICSITQESKKELGIDISTLPIEEFTKTDEKFDLIMSFHVLEHLRNPLEVMICLSSMLSHNGYMLMHVPIDDQEISNNDHLHFFSNESCLKLMEQTTTDIRSDLVLYPIRSDSTAVAATYVGRSKNIL